MQLISKKIEIYFIRMNFIKWWFFDRNMEFCEFIKVRDNFSINIVFSDKARFELHGNVNANADNSWTLSTHISKSILIKRNSIIVF